MDKIVKSCSINSSEKLHAEHCGNIVDVTGVNPKNINEVQSGVINSSLSPNEKLNIELIGQVLVVTMKFLAKEFRSKDAHCKVCGGFREELAVDFKGKRYHFTCHTVEDLKTKKELRGTDYQKFAGYLKSKEQSRKDAHAILGA